jgi:hypothetical protein
MSQQVQIIDCTAIHDEISTTKNPNHMFSFCLLNAICSHGNKIVESAVEEGVHSGKLSEFEAGQLLNVLRETEIKLSHGLDRVATARKILSGKNTNLFSEEDLNLIKSRLDAELGSDESKWRQILQERQLILAAPKIAVTRQLQELGLLTCASEVTHVDADALVAGGDPRNH